MVCTECGQAFSTFDELAEHTLKTGHRLYRAVGGICEVDITISETEETEGET